MRLLGPIGERDARGTALLPADVLDVDLVAGLVPPERREQVFDRSHRGAVDRDDHVADAEDENALVDVEAETVGELWRQLRRLDAEERVLDLAGVEQLPDDVEDGG